MFSPSDSPSPGKSAMILRATRPTLRGREEGGREGGREGEGGGRGREEGGGGRQAGSVRGRGQK